METYYDLDMHKLKKKLAGFGSDGGSVPSLVSVHCIAHKVALAASGSASHVPIVNRFKGLLNGMFHYLHQSPARFVEVQTAFNLPQIKLKEAKDVRWLSCSEAVIALQRNLLPITVFMISEAEQGRPLLLGWLLHFSSMGLLQECSLWLKFYHIWHD